MSRRQEKKGGKRTVWLMHYCKPEKCQLMFHWTDFLVFSPRVFTIGAEDNCFPGEGGVFERFVSGGGGRAAGQAVSFSQFSDSTSIPLPPPSRPGDCQTGSILCFIKPKASHFTMTAYAIGVRCVRCQKLGLAARKNPDGTWEEREEMLFNA